MSCPYWASSLAKNAVVGAHIFYRWAGGWGQPAAFTRSYAGREPNSQALRAAAVAAAASRPIVAQAIAAIPAPKSEPHPAVECRSLQARRAQGRREAPHAAYVDTFAASDNLRWSLRGGAVEASETPLGQPRRRRCGGGGSGAAQR